MQDGKARMTSPRPQQPTLTEEKGPNIVAPGYSPVIRRTQRLFAIAILLAAAGITAAGIYVDHINDLYEHERELDAAQSQLALLRARIEGNITSNIQTVQGIVAAIHTEPDMGQQRFSQLAAPLFNEHTQLRNIGAAPDLLMRMVYPLVGNESAIGLNFLANNAQREAALRARDTGRMAIAGPVNLVQGGAGFVGRIPIFIERHDGTRYFWGLISAVIDTEKLYEASGLRDPNLALDIAIRGKDGSGTQGDAFFGDNSVFARQPVTAVISLPDGFWEIAALPKGGWPAFAGNVTFVRATIATGCLLILLPMLMVAMQALKRQENEIRLQALVDLSPIGIGLNDYDNGKFIEANDALLASSGYSREEFLKLSYWKITPHDYEEREQQQLRALSEIGRYGPYEKEYIRKDGSRYPVLLNGILIHDRHGKPLIWSIIEDISERKKNQRTLTAHQQQLELVLASTAVGVWNWHIPSGATEYNTRWAEIVGYTLEELAPVDIDTWISLVHPDDLIESSKVLEAHIRGEHPRYDCEVRMRHKSGDWVWVLNTGKIVEWTADGQPQRMVGTQLDITHQRQREILLHNSQTELRNFFELSNNILCIANVNGYFEKVNTAFVKKMGISESELLRNPFISFVHPDDIAATITEVAKLSSGIPAVSFVNRYRRGDGSYISLQWNTTPDPTTEKLYASAVDITQQLQSEAALIAARDVAEAATLAKSEFLATMSHEIRTPMNGVLGMLNLLERTQLDNAQLHKLSIARSSATALLTLIDDILDFSKIDAGKLDLDMIDFDLRQLLHGFIELMELRAAEKKLALTLDIASIENPMVRGDPGRLRQIFMNLVGNAIKFTEHGEIVVRCRLERSGNNVRLDASVCDTGIGIAQYKLGILFNAFTQVDASTTRQYGGTGLGLAISKKLCDLMGGEIRVASTLGKGSEFSFSIDLQTANATGPALIPEHNMRATDPTALKWPANTRLLLAEDNAINHEVARMMLEEMGLGIDIASNGLEALTLLKAASSTEPYSLILMDCQMPELDGYDTSRMIRAGHAGAHNAAITIVALTANAMKGDREKCIAAGMNDYLSKPINPAELANLLQYWLQPPLTRNAAPEPPLSAPNGAHGQLTSNTATAQLIWDEREMLASLSGRQERVDTLLKMFCSGFSARLDAVEQALNERNSKQLNLVAHTIKGTAAQLRAQQLRKSASALEAAAAAGDWEQIELLVPRLVADSRQLAGTFNARLTQT